MAHQDINKFNRLIEINAETCQSDVKRSCQVVRKVDSGQNEVVKDCYKEVIVKGDVSSQSVKTNGHKVKTSSQNDKTYGQNIKTIKGKIDLNDCNDSNGRNVMPENQAETGGDLPELTSPKKVESLKKMVFFADINRPIYLAEKVSQPAQFNSPTRAKIMIGKVAELMSKFDSKCEKDGIKPELSLLRLKKSSKSAMKPSSPGQLKKKRTAKGSKGKHVIDPKQSLILDYYREQEASEKGSNIS